MSELLAWCENHAFRATAIVSLFMFFIAHLGLSKACKRGKKTVITACITLSIAVVLLLFAGLRAESGFIQNITGIIAGICFWSIYGEICEKLNSSFEIKTGVEIGYCNLPILILLGFVLGMFFTSANLHPAVFQFANSVYTIWLGHVILLTAYYHPVFGGPAPNADCKEACIKTWSKNRIIAALTALLLVALPVILVSIFYVRPMGGIKPATAAGFWTVLFGWYVVEIAKKLFKLNLW
ncbi:MAG: hypothetical protein HZA48_10730 [Planctomycetes bacterium]|nr:hypothetical protein [Planctomycetota bacterium]